MFFSTVRGVTVSSDDAAKIRKDAETAKENGENLPEDKDLVWDAILEQSDGDEEMAQASVNMMLQNKETAAKKIEKAGPKHADTMAQIIANQKQWKQDVAKAKADLEHWQQIAGVSAERKKAEAERSRRSRAEEGRGSNTRLET